MKYYVYSEYICEGEFVETEEKAIKIAQDYAADAVELGDDIEFSILSIQIYKLSQTLEAKASIIFNVTKEEGE